MPGRSADRRFRRESFGQPLPREVDGDARQGEEKGEPGNARQVRRLAQRRAPRDEVPEEHPGEPGKKVATAHLDGGPDGGKQPQPALAEPALEALRRGGGDRNVGSDVGGDEKCREAPRAPSRASPAPRWCRRSSSRGVCCRPSPRPIPARRRAARSGPKPRAPATVRCRRAAIRERRTPVSRARRKGRTARRSGRAPPGPGGSTGPPPAFPVEDPTVDRQFLPAHPARRRAAALVVVPREVEDAVEDEEENARLRRLLPTAGLRKAGGRGNDDVPRHARAARRDAGGLREGEDVRGTVPPEKFPVPPPDRRVPDHTDPHVGPVRRKESERRPCVRLQPPPRNRRGAKVLPDRHAVSFAPHHTHYTGHRWICSGGHASPDPPTISFTGCKPHPCHPSPFRGSRRGRGRWPRGPG